MEVTIPSIWDPAAARSIVRSSANTTAVIDPDVLVPVLPGRYVWDYWPLRTADGAIADVDGAVGWVALTVPSSIEPEDRHFVSSLRFATSRPGEAVWTDRGELFPGQTAVGARQWAGSTVLDRSDGTVDVFYTACGREGETEVTFEQRLVRVTGRLTFDADGPVVDSWGEHEVILEGDGDLYASTAGEGAFPGRINAFRDPSFHRTSDGRTFLLFTASVGGGDHDFDGAVGIAEQRDGAWVALPPLLTAVGVNKELERPHLVERDGLCYLFFTTHHWTFAPGIRGPEGLYGFVADDLFGPYRPLNDSGLVFGNPESEPHQAYSWLVLEDGTVLSFADYPGLLGRALDREHERDPTFKKRHFGGTVAPPVRIALDGDSAHLV